MKKPIFKRWWFWVIIVFVLVGALGSCSGGSSEDSSNKKETSKTTETKKEEETVHHIGEVVTVGNVEYTVNSITQTDTVGTQYLNTTAQNHFLMIDITVTNKGNDPLDMSSSYFTLVNGEKTYEVNTDASIYNSADGESIIYETVNPDASFTGQVAYDITQETIDSPDLQLQVQTGAFGTEKALINLH